MKKVLLIFVLLITTNLSAKTLSDFIEDDNIRKGYYDGDPNRNEIIEANDDYIIIRNLTALSNIEINVGKPFNVNYQTSSEVFYIEALKHCEKNTKFNIVEQWNVISLDKNTALFYCYTNLESLLGLKNKEDIRNATLASWCLSGKEISIDMDYNYVKDIPLGMIFENNCSKQLKKFLKKWPKSKSLYSQLNSRKLKFEDRTFIFDLKKRIFTNNGTNQISGDDATVVAASSGTGFFVSTNGHMVTNNHVIEGCDTVKAHYKGRELDANVLFTDRANDLAIIKANIKPEKVFPVSNEDVSLLEDIIVAGYPLGKNISASIKTFKGSVTALAGFGDNYSNFQIDASLSSGNSGGPIINQKGNVVGVAVEKLVEVGVEGFNFGVKSSTLKTFASSNQIKFEPASTEELSNKELGQLITEATIYLECWMSVAKIKQIIQEGERQKAFFSEYK